MEIDTKNNSIKMVNEFKYKFKSSLFDIFQTVLWLSILVYLTFYLNLTKSVLFLALLFILLFSLYFTLLILKNFSKIIITNEEIIKSNPVIKTIINWKDITEIKLNYYSTRRDKEKGWMVLLLLNNQKKIVIHSSISSFDKILQEIAKKTSSNNYLFNYYTEKNFKAMGINLYNNN
ncbi:MAG: hypothetical protein CFH01_00447 [Alphaproteobacteria bacterium MarineAlpha2_Bin1]|nr:MAG: hypothetical protein CFH01_00447 [Alphaproteobacteria bacterium MarineAlpha2_Bin1]|tara:strand:- start:843 stop:1370 length:528 start_codon:yes stop_codon:yes gene_type:complete